MAVSRSRTISRNSRARRRPRNAVDPRSRKPCSSVSPAARAGARITCTAVLSSVECAIRSTWRRPLDEFDLAYRARRDCRRAIRRGVLVRVERDGLGRFAPTIRKTVGEFGIEALGERVDFEGQAKRLERRRREQPRELRERALHLGVTRRVIARRIQIAQKELGRRPESGIGEQIGVGAGQSVGLPVPDRATLGRGRRIAACGGTRGGGRAEMGAQRLIVLSRLTVEAYCTRAPGFRGGRLFRRPSGRWRRLQLPMSV